MTRREREARRWWRQGRRDLGSAAIMAEHGRHEVTCFLSQQAAEKALKALLYLQGENPVLGHSILDLSRRCDAYVGGLEPLRPAAKTLDAYYVPSRYPNGLTDDVVPADFFDGTDSERALAASRTILDAVARHLPPAVVAEP